MTHSEFIAWLDGYLTGRDTVDAALIRAKLETVKESAPLDWGALVPPVLGMPPSRLTSGDPMPILTYTTCDSPGIPAVARALADGMKPLGADFQHAIFSDTEVLYEN